jgi:hypothetical protein
MSWHPTRQKLAELGVERSDYGYVQRARYQHPDLHDEEVLEVDSPFASAIASGTHVFTFLLLGDQNAGKSTFLHSFVYDDEPSWLELSSYLPIISSMFLNARFLPPESRTPPRDELPYLDTDVGRASFVLTLEAFAFFCQEFGLPVAEMTFDADTRFVLVQFIEIGGDHLDSLMGAAGSGPLAGDSWLDQILVRSERLLKGVENAIYYVNCATLFREDSGEPSGSGAELVLDVGALGDLLRRLSYLAACAQQPAGLSILVLVSRLPGATATAESGDGSVGALSTSRSVEALNRSLPMLGLGALSPLAAEDFEYTQDDDFDINADLPTRRRARRMVNPSCRFVICDWQTTLSAVSCASYWRSHAVRWAGIGSIYALVRCSRPRTTSQQVPTPSNLSLVLSRSPSQGVWACW